MFGTGTTRPDPGPRPHGLPADPRRQPAGVQRLADDRARRARPAAGDPGARRQGRRGRPAAHAHRQGGRRAPLHPPGHRRAAAVRARPRDLRGGPRRRRSTTCAGLDEVRALARDVHARGRVAWRPGSTPTTIRAARARARGRADRRGLRADRHDDAGVRHDRVVAGRRAQRDHRQPRPAGRRDVHRARPRARRTRAASAAAAAASRSAAGRSRVRGLGEIFGELPVATLGRRDRDARRGPGPRAHHDRRQPRRLDAERRAARRARSSRSTSWSASTSTSTRPRATPT